MIWLFVSTAITAIIIYIAANCNALMDKFMIDYMNLTDNQKTLEHYKIFTPSWWSFDWRAKYENLQNGKRAYNKLLLKVKIKTRLLADNFNDGWHFFKSCMIVLIILSIALNGLFSVFYFNNFNTFAFVGIKCFEFIFYGILWNIAFNHKLNKLKKYGKI